MKVFAAWLLLLALPAHADFLSTAPGQKYIVTTTTFTAGGETAYFGPPKTFGSSVTAPSPISFATMTFTASSEFGFYSSGTWVQIASMTTSATGPTNAITFSGLSSSVTYRLDFNLTPTTTGRPSLRFNADSGSNYTYGGLTISAGGATVFGGAGTTLAYLTYSDIDTQNVGQPTSMEGSIYFTTRIQSPKVALYRSYMRHWRASTNSFAQSFGEYSGAANLSSIAFGDTTFNFQGEMRLYKFQP